MPTGTAQQKCGFAGRTELAVIELRDIGVAPSSIAGA
jgi:hypothetical protein